MKDKLKTSKFNEATRTPQDCGFFVSAYYAGTTRPNKKPLEGNTSGCFIKHRLSPGAYLSKGAYSLKRLSLFLGFNIKLNEKMNLKNHERNLEKNKVTLMRRFYVSRLSAFTGITVKELQNRQEWWRNKQKQGQKKTNSRGREI